MFELLLTYTRMFLVWSSLCFQVVTTARFISMKAIVRNHNHSTANHRDKLTSLLDALEQGRLESSLECFTHLLDACTRAKSLPSARKLHSLLHKSLGSRLLNHPEILSRLVIVYLRSNSYADAAAIFDKMPLRGAAVWNSMIVEHAQSGHLELGLEFYRRMQLDGIYPDAITFRSILSARTIEWKVFKEMRSRIEKQGLESDVGICNALIHALGRFGCVLEASRVFSCALHGRWTIVSWTAMVGAYARNGHCRESRELFRSMLLMGVMPDYVAFVAVVEACDTLAELRFVHGLAVSRGFQLGLVLGNALVAMYGRCGDLASARILFRNLPVRDAISWNSMLVACSRNQRGGEAVQVFAEMMRESINRVDYGEEFRVDSGQEIQDYGEQVGLDLSHISIDPDVDRKNPVAPTAATFIAVLEACSCDPRLLEEGRTIDRLLAAEFPSIAGDVAVATALVSMYSRCGDFDLACQALNRVIPSSRDAVLWTSIITAASDHGRHSESIHYFHQMQLHGISPNDLSIVTVVNSCAWLPSIALGKIVHTWAISHRMETVALAGSLVHMYGRCGSLRDARGIFDRFCGSGDPGIWNTMVAAYAFNGRGAEALWLFQAMENEGVEVDSITFVAVLSTCSHAGMVELGCNFYTRMVSDHEIVPSVQHRGCLADLLGRAGWLEEARMVASENAVDSSSFMLQSLVAACRVHGDLDLGKAAAGDVIRRAVVERCWSSAPYSMLSGMIKGG